MLELDYLIYHRSDVMTDDPQTFDFIEKQIRKKTFGVLTTINPDCTPHSTGILYGVAPAGNPFRLYIITSKGYKKTRNIEKNNDVSLVITYPHHYIRFAPASYVSLSGEAEIIPIIDPVGQEALESKYILKKITAEYEGFEETVDIVFIRLKPNRRVFCYGLGIGTMKLRNSHEKGSYTVTIPEDRI